MANKLISMRIPNTLIKDSNAVIRKEGFSNIQEFIKDCIREGIRRYKLKENLIKLDALAGSGKNPKLATKEELEKHILNIFL